MVKEDEERERRKERKDITRKRGTGRKNKVAEEIKAE